MTTVGRYGPHSALVVVDMQVDFADPTGSLYVTGGEKLTRPIAAEIAAARAAGGTVVFTQDWHPAHTPHFAQDGGLWPVHCVMDSPGAQFVPGLDPRGTPEPVVRKGSGPEDGYSGFTVVDLPTGTERPTELHPLLESASVRELVVVGLAGDWCVKATAVDGAALGYQVTVPLQLTGFVELRAGDTDRAIQEMTEAGVQVLGDQPASERRRKST